MLWKRPASKYRSRASVLAQAVNTGLLCVSVLLPGKPLAAQPEISKRHTRNASKSSKLRSEVKTLQALNRLTFGPKAGDIAEINRVGLEAWFQRQLHPEQIPEIALNQQLAHFPAMQLSQEELIDRFPTPEMLRRYSQGGLTVPDKDVERAIYADAALKYEQKLTAKKDVQNSVTPDPSGLKTNIEGNRISGNSTSASISNNGSSSTMKNTVFSLPPAARMQRLVAMSPQEMQDLQAVIKGSDNERLYAGMTPEQIEQVAAMRSPERLIETELLSVRLLRDVYSTRQLQAVVSDFWLNHFSVYLHKNQNEPYLLPAFERSTIAPHSLGRFEDLLAATAMSPAMLVYLDNWESIGPNSTAAGRARPAQQSRPGTPLTNVAVQKPKGLNENYARELMELHTLGVEGGYTQQDVIEVAKCFTGWTIVRPAQGGDFLFDPKRHEPGDKIVLGHTIHEDGVHEGLQVLHILATSPSTAHFVSLEMAKRFVSDKPAPALVARMATTFLNSDGDIKAVLTTMFHSPEFWSADVYRGKVKTPLEFVVSALRATNADVTNPLPLVQAMDRLGMPIYGMQTPNGYSWQADAWVSSNALLARMNFALVLAGNRLPGTKLNWDAVLGDGVDTAAQPAPATEKRLEGMLLGQAAAASTRTAVLAEASTPGIQQQAEQNFLLIHVASNLQKLPADRNGDVLRIKAGQAPLAGTPEVPAEAMAGLLLGSPDFQRR
ncbi:MAG: DUF1800 domain-containing protein [Janthinobacterium lividum]